MTQAGPTGADVPTGRAARELLEEADRLVGTARAVLDDHGRALDTARAALAPLLDTLVDRELAGIPLARLGDVTEGGCGSERWSRPVI